ncbi:MAG: amidohydrolase family protein [Rhodospirillaceae bacterium]
MRALLFGAAMLALSHPASADVTAIINGTVHTMTDAGVLEKATVLIDDDEIVAVGAAVEIPDGATVIDAGGRPVTPGLMNVVTKIGLLEVGQVDAAEDYGLSGAPFTAAFNVAAGINPDSVLIPITRLDGITRAVTVPSGWGAVFDGLGAVVHLGIDDDIVEEDEAALYTSFGGRSASVMGGARGALDVFLRQAFEDALHFDKNRRDFEKNRTREYVLHHLDLEALLLVLSGEIPMVVDVNRAADMRVLMDLADDYDIRMIFNSAREAWKVAEDLADEEIAVIIDPSNNLPTTFDNIYATKDNARLLYEAGVKFAIATISFNDLNNPRNITQLAGIAVANGLPYDAALKAITRNPAEMFDVDDDYGTLAPGMDADVVVWEGDPLELVTLPTHVFIKGELMPQDNRQLRLRDRYKNLSDPTPMQYR